MPAARSAARLLPSPTATPLATLMVLLLLAAALLLHLYPASVADTVAWASTNVHNLADHPVAAMVGSTFVVPGNLMPNLLMVAVGFAVLERAIGPWRTAFVALTGQVVATLLTEYGIELGAHIHLLAQFSAERPDVGVSYVMYTVLAAASLSLPRRIRIVGLMIVAVSVLYPFIGSPGMTSTGHVLSVAVGSAMMIRIGGAAHRRQTRLANRLCASAA
ncbi:hypothetical protein M6D93_04615 [Jatrophihabitans telluris]|uniref:Rhomboid family intramembrane serine protease n=1 Tax=Jatrophihabitans telluris TaxID=2038343 RepID=A0ABY4R0Q1_9ACTN|nr:rhomboid-like protein [Jatrophihabitans telluris]UQX89290.1 hypothetical protein M6D93_04615 [Jatrophihabitans telluris]